MHLKYLSYHFEPTITFNGIPILYNGCQALLLSLEGRSYIAVTHLAKARSQNVSEYLSIIKIKASLGEAFIFLMWIKNKLKCLYNLTKPMKMGIKYDVVMWIECT